MARYIFPGDPNQLPPITLPSSSPVANGVSIIKHVFSEPNRTLIFEEPGPPIAGPKGGPEPTKVVREVIQASYSWLLITVIAITVVCGILEMVFATLWSQPTPTAFQDRAFDAVDWNFKVGFAGLTPPVGTKLVHCGPASFSSRNPGRKAWGVRGNLPTRYQPPETRPALRESAKQGRGTLFRVGAGPYHGCSRPRYSMWPAC